MTILDEKKEEWISKRQEEGTQTGCEGRGDPSTTERMEFTLAPQNLLSGSAISSRNTLSLLPPGKSKKVCGASLPCHPFFTALLRFVHLCTRACVSLLMFVCVGMLCVVLRVRMCMCVCALYPSAEQGGVRR